MPTKSMLPAERAILLPIAAVLISGFVNVASSPADDAVFRYFFQEVLKKTESDDRPLPPARAAERLMTIDWPEHMVSEVSEKIVELYSRDPSQLQAGAIGYYASWIDTLPGAIVKEAERQLAQAESRERLHLLRALCRAESIRPASLAIIREIASESDVVLRAPACAAWYRHDPAGAKDRVGELLGSADNGAVLRMCDALSLLPVSRVEDFASDFDRLLQSTDLRVRVTAASAILKYDPANGNALSCVAKALREPQTTRICIGYYSPSQPGVPVSWYAASALRRVVRSANVFAQLMNHSVLSARKPAPASLPPAGRRSRTSSLETKFITSGCD